MSNPRRYGRRRHARPFACLPRAVLSHPPINHRARPIEGRLCVFDAAMLAAIVILARDRLVGLRHERALAAGRAALRQQRGKLDKDSKRMNAFRIGGVGYEFALAGGEGYLAGRANFKPPETIEIEVSRSGLLKAARMSDNSRNNGRVDAALTRLREPISAGPHQMPPLLRGVTRRAQGGWTLQVNGVWLPTRRFGRVPLPLPTRGGGSHVAALFLFLAGIDQRGDAATSISVDQLCRRIGITGTRPTHRRRAIEAALRAVNAHIAKVLDGNALTEAKLPLAFAAFWRRAGRVNFIALDAPVTDDNTPDTDDTRVDAAAPVIRARRYDDDEALREREEQEARLERLNLRALKCWNAVQRAADKHARRRAEQELSDVREQKEQLREEMWRAEHEGSRRPRQMRSQT